MNAIQNKFTRYKDQFDSIESTYKHIIYTNQGKKYQLTGYSKGAGLPERKDKEILLQKVILRLLNRNYLKCSDQIEFYIKNYLDNRHDELILRMKPEGYEIVKRFEWMEPFLEKVYKIIKGNSILDENIIVDRAKGFKKIGLDIFLYREICKDLSEFEAKMAELKALGEIQENVLSKFYFTYKNDFKK